VITARRVAVAILFGIAGLFAYGTWIARQPVECGHDASLSIPVCDSDFKGDPRE
jgi:hypothetical protein